MALALERADSPRYVTQPGPDDMFFRVDTFTGRVWRLILEDVEGDDNPAWLWDEVWEVEEMKEYIAKR